MVARNALFSGATSWCEISMAMVLVMNALLRNIKEKHTYLFDCNFIVRLL